MYPAQQEVACLLANLQRISVQNFGTFYQCQVNESRRLQNVCFALPKWTADCLLYGIVPGIAIDAKAVACAFGIPNPSITGRENNGKLLIFLLGFIASATSENFMLFLEQFIAHVRVPPRFDVVDQDFACINAIEFVIPQSFVIVDEWRLNQLKT